MKLIKVSIICTILSLLLFPSNSAALSLEQLPSSKSSNEWEVVIDRPKSDDLESKPDVYNIYSMNIEYIGNKDVKLERVEAFRDDPSLSYDIELFTVDCERDAKETNMNIEPSFRHQNFPISTKATNLKVIVTWTKKVEGSRSFRKEFIFKQ